MGEVKEDLKKEFDKRALRNWRRRGFRSETVLVKQLQKNGYGAVRVPVSNPSLNPLPDIIARRDTEVYAFEVKNVSYYAYFPKQQVEKLFRFLDILIPLPNQSKHAVLAAHMALRGLEPSAADVAYMIEAPTMLVSATIVGESQGFAMNSYMVLDQGGRMIKPITVRADGLADPHATWPESQKFQAKIVAMFRYADFDPKARTTVTIFPAQGGELHVPLNFADIE